MDVQNEASFWHQLRIKFAPHYGIVLGVVSSLLAALCSLLLKMNVNSSSVTIIMYMFGFQATLTFAITVYNQNKVICVKGERIWLLQRILLAGFGNYFMIESLRYISASDMTAILFCTPVLLSIVSPFVTKEKFLIKNILLAFMAVIGVAVVCRPSFIFGDEKVDVEGQRLIGVAWASVSCVDFTYLIIVIKKMPRTPVLTAMSNVGTAIFVSLFAVTLFTHNFPYNCGWNIFLLMAATVSGVTSAMLENISIKKEKVTTFSISVTAQIVFIMLLEAFVLKQVPKWSDYLGAFLILSSILLTVILRARKHYRASRNCEQSEIRAQIDMSSLVM